MFSQLGELNSLSTTLNTLSAMITPVVLISACASLAISTANRLGRTIDRTRKLLDQFEQFTERNAKKAAQQADLPVDKPTTDPSVAIAPPDEDEEGVLLFELLTLNAERSRLLHRAMSSLYMALSIFVASSVALGFISLADERFAWLPLLLGMFGAGLLFYTSILLIAETRIARTAINHEMDFAIRRTQLHASPKMLEFQQRQRRNLLNILRNQ
jgi:hypothetical protein